MILFTISLPLFIQPATAAEPFHHSSAGVYQVQWKEFGPCPPEKRGTNEIFADVRLTKRRQGVTEIVGKYILLIPFDDNITMNADFAILGSNSAWLPNAYNIPMSRACTTTINFLKEGWTEFLKNMGMAPKCPILKGVYELKGYDVNNILRTSMFPKEFFYGRYKISVEYSRFRKVVGCIHVYLHLVPGWQKGSRKNEN